MGVFFDLIQLLQAFSAWPITCRLSLLNGAEIYPVLFCRKTGTIFIMVYEGFWKVFAKDIFYEHLK